MVTFVRIRLYNGFKDNLQVEIFIGIEILLFSYLPNRLAFNSADIYSFSNQLMVACTNKFQNSKLTDI